MTDEEIKNIDPKEVAYITLNSGEIILNKSDVEENKGYQNVEGNVNIKNDNLTQVARISQLKMSLPPYFVESVVCILISSVNQIYCSGSGLERRFLLNE